MVVQVLFSVKVSAKRVMAERREASGQSDHPRSTLEDVATALRIR